MIALASEALATAEDRRRELVATLGLPPETTWRDALERVVLVAPVGSAGAKGCHGCRLAFGVTCATAHAPTVLVWTNTHLQSDLLTPKPGAPECPGRIER